MDPIYFTSGEAPFNAAATAFRTFQRPELFLQRLKILALHWELRVVTFAAGPYGETLGKPGGMLWILPISEVSRWERKFGAGFTYVYMGFHMTCFVLPISTVCCFFHGFLLISITKFGDVLCKTSSICRSHRLFHGKLSIFHLGIPNLIFISIVYHHVPIFQQAF